MTMTEKLDLVDAMNFMKWFNGKIQVSTEDQLKALFNKYVSDFRLVFKLDGNLDGIVLEIQLGEYVITYDTYKGYSYIIVNDMFCCTKKIPEETKGLIDIYYLDIVNTYF